MLHISYYFTDYNIKKDKEFQQNLFCWGYKKSGACFVRTDQLDREIDLKLRLVPATQKLDNDAQLFEINAKIYIEKSQKNIYSFIGTFNRVSFLSIIVDSFI